MRADVRSNMSADLQKLGRRLVGRWTTEATHRGLPGTMVTGSSETAWPEGEQFLIYRSSYDHPDIPDSISIIGDTEGLHMHYFDTRGVHRIFKVTVTGDRWEIVMDRHSSAGSFASPDAPFSQRVTYTFEDEDRTMAGKAMLSYDNVKWDDDLEITCRRML